MIESALQTSPIAAPLPLAPEVSPYSRRQQLLQELLKHNELLLKNRLEVRHLMTRDPVVVPPSMTYEEIVALIRQQRLRHLLVCGRGGEVLGVIGEQDLHARQGATAQQIMNCAVESVSPETPLSPAITYLINENVSCVPVVEKGRLCGALTITDLMLTLQCMLQLWLRLAQVLQQDQRWAKELDEIVATLDRDMTPAQLAERIAKVRNAIQDEVRGLVDAVDLRADVLTGMSNRAGLEEVLDMLLAVQRRFEQPLSLAVVVIDHFQQIKESCGDAVARPLLKAVAWLIKQSVRDCDFMARCRDDAFAIVMPQTSLKEAEAFCARLRDAARANQQRNVQPRITLIAVSPKPDENTVQLLNRAEAAIS